MSWIAFDVDLPDKPKVRQMARSLGLDRDAVVGKLVRVWGWFKGNAVQDSISGIEYDDIDDLARAKGFADAMCGARLLDVDCRNDRLTFKLIGGLHRRSYCGWWQKLRAEVFNRDAYTCAYCGKPSPNPDCDHIVPVCKGGSNDISNLVTACPTCNRSKGGKLLHEWRAA